LLRGISELAFGGFVSQKRLIESLQAAGLTKNAIARTQTQINLTHSINLMRHKGQIFGSLLIRKNFNIDQLKVRIIKNSLAVCWKILGDL
jgi:hypothetical protein